MKPLSQVIVPATPVEVFVAGAEDGTFTDAVAANVVNFPAAAVVTPTEVLLIVLAAVGLIVNAPVGLIAPVPEGDIVNDDVAANAVKVPVAGVLPPITAPSIVPPVIVGDDGALVPRLAMACGVVVRAPPSNRIASFPTSGGGATPY